jgi:hypothetical protein
MRVEKELSNSLAQYGEWQTEFTPKFSAAGDNAGQAHEQSLQEAGAAESVGVVFE